MYCAAGQRGHVAARLLTQLGHADVVNLDGGYRTWQPPVDLLAASGREDSTLR